MHKKIVITLLAVAAITAAHAQTQSYSNLVNRQRLCTNVAEVAKIAYSNKLINKDRAAILKIMIKQDHDDKLNDMYQVAVDTAYDKANSVEDARSMAWAYCMDRTDW